MKPKEIPALIKDTYTAWSEDKAERLAAALAYYTLFSIAPLVIVAVAIAGLGFGEEAARGQIAAQFRQMLGPQAAGAIQAMIANAYHPAAGIVATVIGIVTLLAGAAGVFSQIQDAFNTIWHVKPKEHVGLWSMIKDRSLSFVMVLGIGFILLVSLVLSAALAAASKYAGDLVSGSYSLWHLLEASSSFLVTALLFAMLFKVLPDTDVQWRDVWVGAISTSALFTLGKYLIGLYLGRSSVASAYGAAGSLVVLLLWVYYAAQILFFGAELTRAYAGRFGSRAPVPEDDPVATGAPTGPPTLAPIRRVAATPQPHQEALPAHAVRRATHQAFGKEIQIAGAVGAAVGLVIGLLRPARSTRASHRRKVM